MAPPPGFKPKQEWNFPQGCPETETTYKLSYLPNCGYSRPNPIRPVSNLNAIGDDDFIDMQTVYNNSFQTVQAERAQPIRHGNNLSSSKDRPESCTVYKLSYVPNCISERPRMIIPPPNINWKSDEPFECLTTHKASFVEQPFCRSEPIIHNDNNLKNTGTIDCGTVYNLSYVPNRYVERPQPFRPVNQYHGPTGDINVDTTYNLSYIPQSINDSERPMPFKPKSDFKLYGDENYCDFNTIYKNSYNSVCAERPVPIRHGDNLNTSKDKPESCTVYKLSYVPNNSVERPQPIRPVENLGLSDAPFDDYTTTKLSYMPHPLIRTEPIPRRESQIKWSSGPIDNRTVYNLSYLPAAGEARKPFKPTNQYEKPTGRLETGTTYNLSFMRNDMCWARPEPIKHESDFKLYGDDSCMDYNTIYKNSYQPVQVQRAAPIRHMNNLSLSGERPDLNTVYKLSYIPNCAERSQPIKPKENEWFNDEPFEDYTTTKLSYIPHPLVRTEPIPQRESQIKWSSGPIDNRTVYNMSYQPVRAEIAAPIRPTSQYEKSTEPFEYNTTYGMSYVHHVPPERDPMPWAMQNRWERPIEPMETMTVQKLSYLPPCAVQC